MIVVDTNVASELMRPAPSHVVAEWVRAHRGADLCTTAITLAEIGYGIERLPSGRRKALLQRTARDVFAAFEDFVLAFDAQAAAHYPDIVAARDRAGMPIDGFDAQIASICRARGAALATRNTKDFESIGIDLIDPWFEPPQS